MNRILIQALAAALAVGAASMTSPAVAQSADTKGAPASGGATTGGPNQPGTPMGPTKAGPNAPVTGSNTAAGNSGAGPAAGAAGGPAASKSAADGKPAALSRDDRNFMMKAAQDGIAEVETGQLAQKNGGHPDVKKFGERMVQDHTKAGDELKALAKAKGVTLPEATDRTHARLAKQLSGLTGEKFDKIYAREAGVKDHKSAVALFSRQAQRGNDPDVKAFAAKTLPTLQEHLKMAQAMHDSVMGPSKR